jgi:hypothetical protein
MDGSSLRARLAYPPAEVLSLSVHAKQNNPTTIAFPVQLPKDISSLLEYCTTTDGRSWSALLPYTSGYCRALTRHLKRMYLGVKWMSNYAREENQKDEKIEHSSFGSLANFQRNVITSMKL